MSTTVSQFFCNCLTNILFENVTRCNFFNVAARLAPQCGVPIKTIPLILSKTAVARLLYASINAWFIRADDGFQKPASLPVPQGYVPQILLESNRSGRSSGIIHCRHSDSARSNSPEAVEQSLESPENYAAQICFSSGRRSRTYTVQRFSYFRFLEAMKAKTASQSGGSTSRLRILRAHARK